MSQAASSPLRSVSALRGALERRFPEAVVTLAPVASPLPLAPSSVEPSRRLAEGAITEIVSEAGDGGTSWILRGLAEILERHPRRHALYVDLEGSFYPPAAVAFGVPLDRLLLVRTSELATGLRAIELCLRGGAIPVAVLDVPRGLAPLRLSTYHRLRRRVREVGGALAVLAREPFIPADHRIDLTVRGASAPTL